MYFDISPKLHSVNTTFIFTSKTEENQLRKYVDMQFSNNNNNNK